MGYYANRPVLIVDKYGFLGKSLALHLREKFLVVLVSSDEDISDKNIIHIPYTKRVPVIPDNSYEKIIVCFNGEPEMFDMLPSFMKKAHESESKLIFLTPLRLGGPDFYHKLSHHKYHDMMILVYGDLFEKHGRDESLLSSLVTEIHEQNRMVIPHDGLDLQYPLFLDDALVGIISLAFSEERHKQLQFLFSKQGISSLSLSRLLQKQYPDARIDFSRHKKKIPEVFIPLDGVFVYHSYPLAEKIKAYEILSKKDELTKAHRAVSVKRPKKTHPFLPIGIVLLILFLPIFATVVSFGVGMLGLSLSFTSLKKGDVSLAKNIATVSQQAFLFGSFTEQGTVFFEPIFSKQRKDVSVALSAGERLAIVEVHLAEIVRLWQMIQSDTSKNAKDDFLHIVSLGKMSLVELQKMKAEGVLPASLEKELTKVDSLLGQLANVSDTLSSVLGFEGQKTYAVLFQNNMELRPGGGFIGSYGLLTIKNGKVLSFTVHDVYDADGKLTQHVEPPFALRRYLGVSHWFLRDSNFSPDFLENSRQVRQFLQKETGETVDGVFALDTSFLKNLLGAVGKVSVPDYKEVVTPDNFYLLTQTHAEKDFFPGSTQKKDFLKSLFDALLLKITEEKDPPYTKLTQAVATSLQEKHLFFSFFDKQTQTVFTVNNLSASLWDDRISGQTSIIDTLGVFDANVGANKANYYVTRAVDGVVDLTASGSSKTKITVSYTNASTKSSPFGGDYKNFVRFLIPKKSKLVSVLIDGKPVPTVPAVINPALFTKKGFIPPSELEVEESFIDQNKMIGFFVVVPFGTSKKVSIVYQQENVFDKQASQFSYDLRLLKQPGTQSDAYSLFVSYPTAFQPTKLGQGVSDVGGKLAYATYLTTDKNLSAVFSRK